MGRASSEKRKRENSKEKTLQKKEKKEKHQSSSFFDELNHELMEQLVERLKNDEKMAANPYFHMYKEMLNKKRKSTTSHSISQAIRGSVQSDYSQHFKKSEKTAYSQSEAHSKISHKTNSLCVYYDEEDNKDSLDVDTNNTKEERYVKLLKSSNKKEKDTHKIKDTSPNIMSSRKRTHQKRATVGEFIPHQSSEHMSANLNVKNVRHSVQEKENYYDDPPHQSRQSISLKEEESNYNERASIKTETKKFQEPISEKKDLIPTEIALYVFKKAIRILV